VRRVDPAQGRIEVELVMVPRETAAPFIDAARRAGFDPAGIEVPLEAGEHVLVRLAEASRLQRLSSRRTQIALAVAAAILLMVAIAIPFIRQQQEIAAADSAIDAITEQAAEAARLRQSVDVLSGTVGFMDKERARTGDPLGALALITTLLPDDTYLTQLSLRSGKLTFTGLSPSAADLVALLAKSPAFRAPSFASPVVQGDGGLETFTITVSLAAGAS
jgi:general secretion pathway protein L